MKTLIIIAQHFAPEMGAASSRVLETADGLRTLGWNVKVISALPNYPKGRIFDEYRGKFSSEDNIRGIEVWRYWIYASNSKKALPRIMSMLSFTFTVLFSLFKVRNVRPDYVITESPPLTLGLSGLLIAKVAGARHILNISDLWPLSAYELGAMSKGFAYDQIEKLEHYLYKKSYACTGQSRQIVDQLAVSGSKRTHLYRNGVDARRFEGVRVGARREPSGKLRIVYAGLFGVGQGILGLCENINFADLNAEWHLYGEGAERDEIASFLDANRDRGIHLHSSVKRDEVPAIITRYDAALIPLVKDVLGAVPSKIFEAMAAGLPIIYVGGGEAADIVIEHRAGWICRPLNYAEIGKKIADVGAMSRDDLEAVEHNCVCAAQTVFDRNLQIEKLDRFLSAN